MLDIKYIRQEPAVAKERLVARGEDVALAGLEPAAQEEARRLAAALGPRDP